MSRRPASDSRCIYCLESKPPGAFNREHIIPQAFGKFQAAEECPDAPITLLDTVCTACNDGFGKALDRWLARDSVLGLLRFNDGVKKPGEFKPPSRDAGLTITPTDQELPSGTRLLLGHGKNGTFGFEVERSVGFAKQGEIPQDYYVPEALPSRGELRALFGPNPSFMTTGLTPEEVAAVMRQLGLRHRVRGHVPAPQNAKVMIPLGLKQGQAVAKIAFNYFAAVMGSRIACMPDFNGLRAFIRSGKSPAAPFVTLRYTFLVACDTQDNPRRGHYITVHAHDSRFIAQVSFFQKLTFRVDLNHVPMAVSVPCDASHFYDLGTRRVDRINLPLIMGRVVPMPQGTTIHLT